MAYEPKTWECGEVVSADALNHMEQGIADASSGGAEFIKIMNTTLSFSGHTTGGGGALLDGKTLGELVGNKRIIGFTTSSYFIADIELHGGDEPFRPVLPYQNELKSFNQFGIQANQYGTSTSTYTVDIYAICI